MIEIPSSQIQIATLNELAEGEFNMVLSAHEIYGEFSKSIENISHLLSSLISGINRNYWFLPIPLTTCSNYFILSYFSTIRRHHLQAMMNLRQVLEAGERFAFLIANPNETYFTTQNKEKYIDDQSEQLKNASYKWLKDNYPEYSEKLQKYKNKFNSTSTHFNILNASRKLILGQEGPAMPFFDNPEPGLLEYDLYREGEIGISLLNLFILINSTYKAFIPKNDVTEILDKLSKKHYALYDELIGIIEESNLRYRINNEKT